MPPPPGLPPSGLTPSGQRHIDRRRQRLRRRGLARDEALAAVPGYLHVDRPPTSPQPENAPQLPSPIRMPSSEAPQALPGAHNNDPTPQNNTQAHPGQADIPSSLNNAPALRSRDEFLMTGVTSVPAQSGDCTTCLEPLTTDVVQLSKCGHVFHCTCILFWFKSNSAQRARCPNCRAELFSDGIFGATDDYRENMRARRTRARRNWQAIQTPAPSSGAPGDSVRSSRTNATRIPSYLTTENIELLLSRDLAGDLRQDYEEELSLRQTEGNTGARRRSRSPPLLDEFWAGSDESDDPDPNESRTFYPGVHFIPPASPPDIPRDARRAQLRVQPRLPIVGFGRVRPWMTQSLTPSMGQGVRSPALGETAGIRPVNAHEILRSNDGAGSSQNRNAELRISSYWPPTPPILHEPQEPLSVPRPSSAMDVDSPALPDLHEPLRRSSYQIQTPHWSMGPPNDGSTMENEDVVVGAEADTDGSEATASSWDSIEHESLRAALSYRPPNDGPAMGNVDDTEGGAEIASVANSDDSGDLTGLLD
ncbi:hypothetical protein E8E13_011143 [Curvularia kusanoi]|uniref:RING-type domain-containing protein n=1 Tax=Curvularia kusanoi TaxID=90978 RepID=A0A9P4WB37_CURKU|nr:hypothetical protein E8E13_011143 [Curvularia kusanoi]